MFYHYILWLSFNHPPPTGDNQKRKRKVVTFIHIGNEVNNITKLFRKLDTGFSYKTKNVGRILTINGYPTNAPCR